MIRDVQLPKASPTDVARAIFDGVLAGRDEIFPDPMSAVTAAAWDNGVFKAMEQANASYLGETG